MLRLSSFSTSGHVLCYRYLVKSILSYETDFEMSMAVETGSYLDLGSTDSAETSMEKKKQKCCFY